MRFSLPRTTLVPALLIGLTGLSSACGSLKEKDYPKEAAKVVCDLIYDCACMSTMQEGATKNECLAALEEGTDLRGQEARVDGLTYDGECAEKQLNDIDDLGCDTPDFDSDASCKKPCKLYYGPVEKGGSCNVGMSGFDNCGQGLVCDADSICENPCAEVDYPKVGESCFSGQCEDEAYCFNSGTGFPTCRALPTNGLECTLAGECAEDHTCDMTMGAPGTCMSVPGLNEACPDFNCQFGLVCDAMTDPAAPVCVNLPGNGQPCFQDVACAPGLLCNADDPMATICEMGEAPVCGAWNPLPPPAPMP